MISVLFIYYHYFYIYRINFLYIVTLLSWKILTIINLTFYLCLKIFIIRCIFFILLLNLLSTVSSDGMGGIAMGRMRTCHGCEYAADVQLASHQSTLLGPSRMHFYWKRYKHVLRAYYPYYYIVLSCPRLSCPHFPLW